MGGLFSLLTDVLVAAFGVDAAALRTEIRVCYNGIRNAVAAMVIGLPICYFILAAGMYYLDLPYAEWCHALYALIAIGSLARIYRHIMVGYGLIEANKAFAAWTLKKAADISAAGGDGAEALAKAIVNAQERFKAIIKQPTGEWSDMVLQAMTESLTPLRLTQDGVKAVLRYLATDISELSTGLKDIRANAWAKIKKEALPTSQFFVRLAVGIILFSLVNTVWPWWTNPPAYLLAVVAGILSLAASFNSMKVEVNPEEAAKPLFPDLPTWLKRSLYLGVVCAIVLVFKVSGFDSLGGIKNHLALAYLTATPFLALVMFYAYHLGWQKTSAYALAVFAISAIAWANCTPPVPRYLRTAYIGGLAKCERHEAGDAVSISNTFWSRRGSYIFPPRQPKEVLDINTTLFCLDSRPEKDIAGELWVRVVGVDSDGHPLQEVPYYVCYRQNMVEDMPDPGTPGPAAADPTYDQAAGHKRIDANNTIQFMRAMVLKFGTDFQHSTWLGFKEPPGVFAIPLNVPFAFGNGFCSAITAAQNYSGVDMYCPLDQVEAPVLAAADGIIDGLTLNQYLSVTIRHANGIWTHYGHLAKIAANVPAGPLRSGTAVKAGEVIGAIARGQKFEVESGAASLFFACVRRQTNGLLNPVDPMPILGKAPYPPVPWEIQKQQEEESSFANYTGDEDDSN